MHQYATLEDTLYFGFAANLTSGAAGDGATPLFDVRLCGAAADAAPVLSGTPTLLTHANYSDGLHEVAIAATAANGFAAGNTYLVFVTLTIDSVTPAAMIGSFRLAPVPANATQLSGDSTAADNAEAFFDGTGYAGTNNVIPTVTTLTGHTAQTGDSYALANGANGFVAIKGDTAAVKTKADSLTFTVAGQVDANIQYINDVQIQGAGVENADEWRPV
ncbi:MAG: hypothetical protein NUV51_03845 [Sulfuricaulis sp.]|nr:hypothetical protein [Sulfuricaulis sp.]